MGKIFLVLVSVGVISFANCNSKTDKEKDKDNNTEDVSNDDGKDTDSDFKQAATQYCKCINYTYADLDPAVKELMIATAHAKDPAVSLADELKERDADEREVLIPELKKMSANTDGRDCSNKMMRNANIEEDDLDGLRQILKIGERYEDCEFMAAMLRHSINSKERKKKREQTSDGE